MKKFLLLMVGLLLVGSNMSTSAADVLITKEQACDRSDAGGYLSVKWPGMTAENFGYGTFTIGNQKVLLYVVSATDSSKNTPSLYSLFSYECTTKKLVERASVDGFYIPIYVDSYSLEGSNTIILKSACSGGCGGSTVGKYLRLNHTFHVAQTPQWTRDASALDLSSPTAFSGYETLLQEYLGVIKQEASVYKEKLLKPVDLGMLSSPDEIINGTIAKGSELLSQANFSASLISENGSLLILLGYGFEIYDDTASNGRRYISMPSLITPKIINQNATTYTLRGDEVKRLYDNGLTKYQDLASFNPQNSFTREQAAKFYSQFAMNVFKKKINPAALCFFDDIDTADATLKQDVITSCQLGLFKGSKGKFSPKRQITAEEATAVLVRILFGMSDETMQPRYQNYIMKAGALGVLPSYGYTLGQPVNRGTVAKMIYMTRAGNFIDINKEAARGEVVSYNGSTLFTLSALYGKGAGEDTFTETDNNIYVRKFFVPTDMVGSKGNTAALSYPWMLQYNKETKVMTMLDTADTTTLLITDTYIAYIKGYCYEFCGESTLYVENRVTKEKLAIPSAVALAINDETKTLTYNEISLGWVVNGASCTEPDETMIGLGTKCVGGKTYVQTDTETKKTIALP